MGTDLEIKLKILGKLTTAQDILTEGIKELDATISELREQTRKELEKGND